MTKKELEKQAEELFKMIVLKDGVCEVCGEGASVAHHFIRRSKSLNLKYNPINGIPLCKTCHFKIHSGHAELEAIIVLKRGEDWLNQIVENKKVVTKSKKFLEEVVDNLTYEYKRN